MLLESPHWCKAPEEPWQGRSTKVSSSGWSLRKPGCLKTAWPVWRLIGANATIIWGLDYVQATLLAAGVPGWMSGPLMAMYRAPRHIKVEGAIGAARTPVRCIPPGCPAAVDILALLTLPWL